MHWCIRLCVYVDFRLHDVMHVWLLPDACLTSVEYCWFVTHVEAQDKAWHMAVGYIGNCDETLLKCNTLPHFDYSSTHG